MRKRSSSAVLHVLSGVPAPGVLGSASPKRDGVTAPDEAVHSA